MFRSKPKCNVYSSFDKGDYPKIDTSELLDKDGVQKILISP